MDTPRPEDELDVVDAATHTNRHPNTVDRALRDGSLPCRWRRGRRLIRVVDLDAWAAARRRPSSPEAP